MNFIQRLFGAKTPPASAPASQPHSQLSPNSTQQLALSQNSTRRELLRVALRDTLQRHGIPAQWIGAECLTSTSRNGERGIHWRLLVKHWDTRLLAHGIGIQNALIKRVMTFDPVASTWLTGISWQFALPDESVCPPLPHSGSWTADAQQAAPASSASTGDGGIIEGPVRIAASAQQPASVTAAPEADAARADLDKLLAIRDADFRRHTAGDPAPWTPTEPAKLSEEP